MRWLDGITKHEFEQAPGVGDGQGRLACFSPWGRKERDTTKQLTELNRVINREEQWTTMVWASGQ